MNVGFLCKEMFPFHFGGIGVQFHLLRRLLEENGHRVSFITRRPRRLPAGWQREHYAGVAVEFVATEEETLPEPYAVEYARRVQQHLPAFADAQQLDLLVAAEFEAEAYFLPHGFHTLSGRWVPILTTLHGPASEVIRYNGRKPTAYELIVCAMEDEVLTRESRLISPSASLWQEIATRLRLEPARATIIPNLANASAFAHRPFKPAANAPRRIFFSGRLEHRKGADLLLEAFQALCTRQPELSLELLVAGRDLHWPAYGTTFIQHWKERLPAEVAARVHFVGHLAPAELARELARSWVAVFPSRWEPFGIVALEAVHAGVPVIVPRDTGLAEIVGPEYPLISDNARGSAGIVECLERVLADRKLRDELSRRLQQRAQELKEQATASYLQVLARPPAPGPLPPSAAGNVAGAFHAWMQARETAHRDEAARLTSVVAERDARITALDRQFEVLKAEDEVIRRTFHEFEQTIARRDQTIAERDQAIARSDARSVEHERALRETSAGLQHAEKTLLARDTAIREATERIRALEEGQKAAVSEIVTRDRLLHESERREAEFAATIQARDARATALSCQIEELTAAFHASEAEIQRRDRDIAAAHATIHTRDSRLNELAAALEQCEAGVASRDFRVAELAAALQRCELAVTERDSRVAELGTALQQCELAVAERDSRIAETNAALHTRDERILELAAALEQLERAVQSRDTRLRAAEKYFSEIEHALRDGAAAVAERDRRVQELAAANAALEQRSLALVAALERCEQEVGRRDRRILASDERTLNLDARIGALDREVAARDAAIQERDVRLAAAAAQLAAAEQRAAATADYLHRLEGAIRDLEREIAARDAGIRQRDQIILDRDTTIERVLQEQRTLQAAHQELRAAHEQLEARRQELSAQLARIQDRLHRLLSTRAVRLLRGLRLLPSDTLSDV